MDKIDWLPFIKAAIERNPVCFNDLNEKSTDEVYKLLINMSNDSVYDNNRLALPDEIWNFKRGDGIEKALLLSDIIVQRENSAGIEIIIDREKVSLESAGSVFQFTSHKNFRKRISIRGKEISVE